MFWIQSFNYSSVDITVGRILRNVDGVVFIYGSCDWMALDYSMISE